MNIEYLSTESTSSEHKQNAGITDEESRSSPCDQENEAHWTQELLAAGRPQGAELGLW